MYMVVPCCSPAIEIGRDGIMKSDIVIAGDDNSLLIVSSRKKFLKSHAVVVKLGVVAPLAFVENVTKEKYCLRTENIHNRLEIQKESKYLKSGHLVLWGSEIQIC